MFEKLKDNAVSYRKNKYDYEVLIDNKNEIKKKYKDLNIDKANIDEMMYLLLRGEKSRKLITFISTRFAAIALLIIDSDKNPSIILGKRVIISIRIIHLHHSYYTK